jgi:hypothetical protein
LRERIGNSDFVVEGIHRYIVTGAGL